MKIFDQFNQATDCPICNTNKEGKAVLIPIIGTFDDGVIECKQVHLDCINLTWQKLYDIDGENNFLIFHQLKPTIK